VFGVVLFAELIKRLSTNVGDNFNNSWTRGVWMHDYAEFNCTITRLVENDDVCLIIRFILT